MKLAFDRNLEAVELENVRDAHKGGARCARSTTPFVTDARLESGDGSLLSHTRGGCEPVLRPRERERERVWTEFGFGGEEFRGSSSFSECGACTC